jgi:hypothetical protein
METWSRSLENEIRLSGQVVHVGHSGLHFVSKTVVALLEEGIQLCLSFLSGYWT